MRAIRYIFIKTLDELVVITLLILTCIGCEKENTHYPNHNGETSTITISFNTFSKTKSNTIPDNIADINLFIFDETQALIKHLYLSDGGTTTMEIAYGTKTIVAIANIGNKDFSQCTTLTLLKESKHNSMIGTGGNMIFSGELTYKFSPNSKSVVIPLTRVLSKITYLFDKTNLHPNVNITIVKIQLMNVPTECSYLAYNTPNSSNIEHTGDALEGVNLDPQNHEDATPLYMFENMQGTIGANSNPITKHPGAKENVCTYVEITADYSSSLKTGTIKYRNFLGLNTTNNYDIVRGKHYKETIIFNGTSINEISWRVDVSDLHDTDTDPDPLIIAATGISLDKGSLKLIIGDNYQLNATVLPLNATNQEYTWSSSNPTVVSINPVTGKLSAHNCGLSTITVTSCDGGFQAICIVNVYEPITLYVDIHEKQEYNHNTDEIIDANATLFLRANLTFPSNMTIVKAIEPFVTVKISYSYRDKGITYYNNATLKLDNIENNDRPHLVIGGEHKTIFFTTPSSEQEILEALESISITVSPGSVYIQNWYVTW